MFSWKKEEKKRPNAKRTNLSQFGLMDIPDDFGNIGISDDIEDDNDEDLEAELMALTTESKAHIRPKRGKPPSGVNLDVMIAESMTDIPSDDDESVDENDPELLAELGDLMPEDDSYPQISKSQPVASSTTSLTNSQVSLLEQRLVMYQEAEKNAKQAGDASRARRFSRGIKTLTDQLKQAKAGRLVPENEIPPEVAVNVSKKTTEPATDNVPAELPVQPPSASSPQVPPRPSRMTLPPPGIPTAAPPVNPKPSVVPGLAPSQPIETRNVPPRPSRMAPPPPGIPTAAPLVDPKPSVVPNFVPPEPIENKDVSQVAELLNRQLQFKQAALAAKKSGDNDSALKYMRIVKQFDSVIAAVKSGNPVDLSDMPELPVSQEQPTVPFVPEPKSPPVAQPEPQQTEVQGEGSAEVEPTPKAPNLPPELLSPPPPTNVAESLAQRLARYQAEERLAKESGNSSKARRMGRICKQYQDAIKLHKAGRPIPVEELPTPPGYAPIPVPGAPATVTPQLVSTTDENEPMAKEPPAPSPRFPSPTPPKVVKVDGPITSPTSVQRTGSEVRKSPQSRQEKQTALLLARQREFKEAALAAKKRGEVEQAKEFLKQAKGFDPLIQASNGGLPVDISTLPVSPSSADAFKNDGDFEYVTPDDCKPGGSGEIYDKLEEDLTKQIKLCIVTRDHFKATGDVAGGNRFDHLSIRTQRDLLLVRDCRKKGDPVPRFRYETRSFSILQCCTDLGDNDLELSIIQGINYNVPNPKEVDTYVKYEFPYPAENTPKDKTALIRDTNNPQYKQTFKIPFARTNKSCQRVFKRHGIKLEIWSKGGFLRGDTLIGTVTVKLQPLETKCEIHDSFPLMDGRKTVGGQLEVRVRVRNPIVTKQMEQRQERWLVLVENA